MALAWSCALLSFAVLAPARAQWIALLKSFYDKTDKGRHGANATPL